MIFSNFVKLISGINYDGNIIILNEVVYHELDGYLILDIFENHDIFPYLIHPNKTKEWHVKLDKIIPNRDGMFPFSRSTPPGQFGQVASISRKTIPRNKNCVEESRN